MEVHGFDSTEQMLEWMKDAQARAAEHTAQWQEALTPGDHFAIFDSGSGLIIYGEALEDEESSGGGESLMRFARCFSPVVPDGELGYIHVGQFAGLLTAEQFENARGQGWPDEIEAFERIAAGDPRWTWRQE